MIWIFCWNQLLSILLLQRFCFWLEYDASKMCIANCTVVIHSFLNKWILLLRQFYIRTFSTKFDWTMIQTKCVIVIYAVGIYSFIKQMNEIDFHKICFLCGFVFVNDLSFMNECYMSCFVFTYGSKFFISLILKF